ncbi:MAG: isoprenoid biosynthesis glyoxalase ElbB [Prevotellaceae bacterium]|jgi:enhancing lycopene biosynthesis protein 2|nr:isoprenoid biosynthesis glyoxalase ElbB [Prevotellaceae bacterium]
MKRIAVILSGCGVFDGSEIHETVLLLLAAKRAGCDCTVFAPDAEQTETVNHSTGARVAETRNILVEANRIARGAARSLAEFAPAEYDALILPGGFGAVKNLCDFYYKGADFAVIPALEKALLETHRLNKPVGATCIAPILLAKVFKGCRITLGAQSESSDAAVKIGAEHVVASRDETVTDETYRLVSTPAYMCADADISTVAAGAENLMREILKLA